MKNGLIQLRNIMMKKGHAVIIIPGLGDDRFGALWIIQKLTNYWSTYGLTPIVYAIGWHNGEKEFQPKLNRLIKYIDALSKTYEKISLVGTSAGASAALNAFFVRRKKVYKAISVCGRLFPGSGYKRRSLENMAKNSPPFRESVLLFARTEPTLTRFDRRRLMTIRARFGDEMVPAATSVLEGATNVTIPLFEHVVCIGLAFMPKATPIIDFLTH